MSPRIASLETLDVRFPTSLSLDGSDAMNPDPDYSAAYVVLRTDADDHQGHGLAFTIGRGTEVAITAIEALAPLVVGADVDDLRADMGAFARRLAGDSQLRWLGPEKGVMHMAMAAVINAVWDLLAKRDGVPLWKLLAGLSPDDVVRLIDFRYIEDLLTPVEALEILRAQEAGKAEREALLLAGGIPAYTTSAGWLGYDDDKLRRLLNQAVDDGFTHLKLKVGSEAAADDERRCRIAREVIGPDLRLMVDANQRWGVDEAIARIERLRPFDLWWVEEPTSPDDILGHAAISAAVPGVALATGEHVHNRVMFKQLLQARAIAFCQIDACRLAGVNEAIAVQLMAAKLGVPVCPHAGGVGLCEMVQHLSAFDYVAVAGTFDGRVTEFVDHLHEHFVDPCVVERGHYRAPTAPGYSTEIRREALEQHAFPHGAIWTQEAVL